MRKANELLDHRISPALPNIQCPCKHRKENRIERFSTLVRYIWMYLAKAKQTFRALSSITFVTSTLTLKLYFDMKSVKIPKLGSNKE